VDLAQGLAEPGRLRGEVAADLVGVEVLLAERQRDLSIRFTWGHNHDFGRFQLEGRMGDRHITLMRNFLTLFGIPRDHFAGRTVLDVGCWTGGTMLILAGLGARVTSIEEVRKYARMAAFLAESFGVDARVEGRSVYGIDDREAYDVAYFPGVIYHLSDPVLALRRLCNALRTGGEIYVESAGTNVRGSVCRYEGCVLYHQRPGASAAALNRGGWNWFIPSPLALARMLWAAGFDGVRVAWADGRLYAHATKTRRVGITRAGLSRTDVP
jgi:SAM-dependent methyltransferase